jgi:glycerol dehydrogenase-like iron-containing ADH family enzyme
MTQQKGRLTVTVDRTLIAAASSAVAAGRADSLSGWVNLALSERAAKEKRLFALASAVAAFEAEFGVLSSAELAEQERADRRSAVVVRGPAKPKTRRARRASK